MTILPCILLVVAAHIVFTGARVTSSLYALANGSSTFTVGVLMALFALVPMLTAVRAGKWLDRTGRTGRCSVRHIDQVSQRSNKNDTAGGQKQYQHGPRAAVYSGTQQLILAHEDRERSHPD